MSQLEVMPWDTLAMIQARVMALHKVDAVACFLGCQSTCNMAIGVSSLRISLALRACEASGGGGGGGKGVEEELKSYSWKSKNGSSS